MTLRIVAMLRKGELDPNVAVQLLGQLPAAVDSDMEGGAPKRKREADAGDEKGDDDDISGDMGPVEDVFQQAKQAKRET